MKEKITFPQLVELVANKTNTTSRMSELFLQELFAIVTQEVAEGKSVTIKGLGTFKAKKDDTGKDVAFTPDKDLAEAVNAPFAQFVPVELCDEVTDELLNEIDIAMEQPAHNKNEIASSIFNENVETAPTESEDSSEEAVIEPALPKNELEDAGTTSALITQEQPVQQTLQEEPVAQETKSRNPRIWLIAAASAVALIAVWYFFTHRSKDRSDEIIETTQIAKNDTTVKDSKPQPVVTDTIGNGNVLFTMAKKHYGDQAFWVYIARENQTQYPDYRKIKSGSVLIIPPAEKYGINSDSKQSIKQANAEAMKLYKEVKAANANEQQKDTVATKPPVQKTVKSKGYKSTRKQHNRNYSSHKKYRKRRR